jgi:biotin carboxyl carrier protein
MFKVNTDTQSFELDADQIKGLDLVQMGPGKYSLIENNKVYTLELIAINNKQVTVAINGRKESFDIQDNLDLLVDQLGLAVANNEKVDSVLAPMPGLVLQIMVNMGDEVEEGQPLLILEAMKMENVIKSPTSGVINNIDVAVGDAVEKKKVLLTFE